MTITDVRFAQHDIAGGLDARSRLLPTRPQWVERSKIYTGAYASPEDEIRARAAGSDGFLIQPAPADVLLKTLQQLMVD